MRVVFSAVVVEHSVLIIRQTREIHREIGELLRKLETGDPLTEGGGGLPAPAPAMGGFSGGFGGGLPSVRPE